MTARLKTGDRIATRTLSTLQGRRIQVPGPQGLTHLQFRRFAGCPVCSLHLNSFRRREAELRAAGVHEVVLFHASDEALRPYAGDLPFDVVGDPEKALYRAFGVEAGARALADPRAWPAIGRAIVASLRDILLNGAKTPPLNPEGGRFGLPADVLIDPAGVIQACHYGEHADDQWSVDEVLGLAGLVAGLRGPEIVAGRASV